MEMQFCNPLLAVLLLSNFVCVGSFRLKPSQRNQHPQKVVAGQASQHRSTVVTLPIPPRGAPDLKAFGLFYTGEKEEGAKDGWMYTFYENPQTISSTSSEWLMIRSIIRMGQVCLVKPVTDDFLSQGDMISELIAGMIMHALFQSNTARENRLAPVNVEIGPTTVFLQDSSGKMFSVSLFFGEPGAKFDTIDEFLPGFDSGEIDDEYDEGKRVFQKGMSAKIGEGTQFVDFAKFYAGSLLLQDLDFGPENAGMIVKDGIGYFRRFDVGWSFCNLHETVQQTLSVDWDHPEGGEFPNYLRYWAPYDSREAESLAQVFAYLTSEAAQQVLSSTLVAAQARLSALNLDLRKFKDARLDKVFDGEDSDVMGWLHRRLLERMSSFGTVKPPVVS